MTMTEQQIVVTLATKVMGWSKEQIDFLYPAWNPLQNIADAWMIVEKFKTLRETNYLAYLVFYEHIPSSIYAITPRTICDAALEALELVA
ncbi:BC1872 family protein [Brevibacillus brevis]|uniref:BC1872 family protein n=1 Tax=Brevibacillus brevis TaxID=1393 RepID=UPI000D0F2D7A|nr:hypothetical protein [Brevibacillus brevis]PSJ66313.1 hypothetical protein C7J99_26620 [Brevibacillus brevis]RED21826.1 hypothetical protein DES34_11891 [Brevibacillus brevis]GEC93065.1 hypothetical protein BBR01nite_53960 [Brevibacillus brevis]VEF92689.1 Uncharacterised protein [Brevibacillus brevis]